MILASLLASQIVVVEEDPRLGEWVPGVTVSGRLSFLSGSISPGDVDYADNFDEGFGLSVELELLRVVAPGQRLGAYLSGAWDRFDGDEFQDPFGTSVEPDELDLGSSFIGVKSVIEPELGLRLEGRLGLGVARYEAVEADVLDQFIPLGKLDFFDASWEPAFEIAGRFGYGSPSLIVGLGAAFRIQGGPEEADESDFLLDPDEVWVFVLDLGASLRF